MIFFLPPLCHFPLREFGCLFGHLGKGGQGNVQIDIHVQLNTNCNLTSHIQCSRKTSDIADVRCFSPAYTQSLCEEYDDESYDEQHYHVNCQILEDFSTEKYSSTLDGYIIYILIYIY